MNRVLIVSHWMEQRLIPQGTRAKEYQAKLNKPIPLRKRFRGRWYPVQVFWGNESIKDAIKGTSPNGALKNAHWNWEDATKIELLPDNTII